MFSFQKRSAIVSSLLLTYYHCGPKTGTKGTFLFLHGWGSNSTLWFKSVAGLAEKGYSLYCLDLPGFGESQNPKEPFFLQDYSNTVMGFIKKLGLKNIILVGHSFGGKTAIKLATENSEFLKSIILVDASGLPHKSTLTDIKIMVAKVMKPAFSLPFMRPLKDRLVDTFASEDYTTNPALKQTFINIVNENVLSLLEQIKKPALIIWGEDDDNTYTPNTDASILHHGIAGSKLVTIPNAGHYSFLDQPELFLKHVSQFLSRLK